MLKYGTGDARDILERSSARETAARAVTGYLAKQLLGEIGVGVLSHVVAIGEVEADPAAVPGPGDGAKVDASPVRTLDAEAERAMMEAIEAAAGERDTLGGVVEVLAFGLPPGVGSHVHWDRRLDARLAAALASIQAIKAVEFGDGVAGARRRGSEAHDEILYTEAGFDRASDRAGGIEGGMTTGQPLRVRAAMKPLSTLMQPLRTVDVRTKEADQAFRERSDVCAVPAAGVVAEAMVAFVLADEVQRMFGGDTVEGLREAAEAYRRRLAEF
jgi:chorismate synthase